MEWAAAASNRAAVADILALVDVRGDEGAETATRTVEATAALASAEEPARLVGACFEGANVRDVLPLAGSTYVFTGELAGATRDEARRRAEALGARTMSALSRKVDVLVAGAKAGPSKLSKARGLDVEVIDEATWNARAEEARAAVGE
jgi:NAD-dependent DNA ligase